MPASATKNNIKNNQERINFKSEKKLHSVLTQNDEIWVIFCHLQAILQLVSVYRAGVASLF